MDSTRGRDKYKLTPHKSYQQQTSHSDKKKNNPNAGNVMKIGKELTFLLIKHRPEVRELREVKGGSQKINLNGTVRETFEREILRP